MTTPRQPDPRERERDRDELLCLRCQRGERAAWEQLVERWQAPLHYFLRRLSHNESDALQALQETWIQVFSSLPTLQQPRRLAPWLYTLARRCAWRERERAGPALADVDAEVLEDGGEPSSEAFDSAEAVHWGLGRLPPHQAEALSLFFLDDLSLREIAEVLDLPLGTVKSRLHAARRALAALLGPTHANE